MAEYGYGWFQWPVVLVVTATVLSTLSVAQTASAYTAAYIAAPQEIAIFIDTADFSIEENEGYDRDVAKIQRLEDKIRLDRLLRKIQKSGNELREELNSLVMAEGGTTLRPGARLLWVFKRPQIEDHLRRLDLLRMRFLVVYMGVVASNTQKALPIPKDPEKISALQTPPRPVLPPALAEGIVKPPPLRRLTTQAIGHHEHVGRGHRKGWAGVVEELQTSPRMQQRHASIEQAMRAGSASP